MTDEPPNSLSPSARELFRAARGAALPSPADRVRAAARRGELRVMEGAPDAEAPLLSARTSGVSWSRRMSNKTKLLLAAAVFITVSSAAAVRIRAAISAATAAPSVAVGSTPPPTAAPVKKARQVVPEPPTPEPAPIGDVPSRVDRGSRAMAAPASSAKDDMDSELPLLQAARQALAAHRSSDALRLLAEDARAFPNSPFREERAYARIRALCELGRAPEARTDADRFLRQWPSSVYATGVRRSCPFVAGGASANDSVTGSRTSGH